MVVLVATRMKTQDLRICGNNTNVQAFSLESVFLHVGSLDTQAICELRNHLLM